VDAGLNIGTRQVLYGSIIIYSRGKALGAQYLMDVWPAQGLSFRAQNSKMGCNGPEFQKWSRELGPNSKTISGKFLSYDP
jgi:hypothetical protein